MMRGARREKDESETLCFQRQGSWTSVVADKHTEDSPGAVKFIVAVVLVLVL
jgi:hypothetical protein